jgi:hypothetical protein
MGAAAPKKRNEPPSFSFGLLSDLVFLGWAWAARARAPTRSTCPCVSERSICMRVDELRTREECKRGASSKGTAKPLLSPPSFQGLDARRSIALPGPFWPWLRHTVTRLGPARLIGWLGCCWLLAAGAARPTSSRLFVDTSPITAAAPPRSPLLLLAASALGRWLRRDHLGRLRRPNPCTRTNGCLSCLDLFCFDRLTRGIDQSTHHQHAQGTRSSSRVPSAAASSPSLWSIDPKGA